MNSFLLSSITFEHLCPILNFVKLHFQVSLKSRPQTDVVCKHYQMGLLPEVPDHTHLLMTKSYKLINDRFLHIY